MPLTIINQLRVTDLSTFDLVDVTEPGAFVIGYDSDNPGRLIRIVPYSGGGGGPPTGGAGGVLSGTYPNPGFAVNMATQAELDAAVVTLNETIAAKADPLDTTTPAPASNNSTGAKGQRIYAAGYIYDCIATNTWIRHGVQTTFTT